MPVYTSDWLLKHHLDGRNAAPIMWPADTFAGDTTRHLQPVFSGSHLAKRYVDHRFDQLARIQSSDAALSAASGAGDINSGQYSPHHAWQPRE